MRCAPESKRLYASGVDKATVLCIQRRNTGKSVNVGREKHIDYALMKNANQETTCSVSPTCNRSWSKGK